MLYVLSSVYFNEHRSALAQLAIHHRLPTMFVSNLYAEAGGLMSYGPSLLAMWRRAADYVDRLGKGAKPADLPIEQPSKFDLVLNARTAKALGVTLPPQLIARADEVIE
jgi:putative ABC transport system substrate-binding protein